MINNHDGMKCILRVNSDSFLGNNFSYYIFVCFGDKDIGKWISGLKAQNFFYGLLNTQSVQVHSSKIFLRIRVSPQWKLCFKTVRDLGKLEYSLSKSSVTGDENPFEKDKQMFGFSAIFLIIFYFGTQNSLV